MYFDFALLHAGHIRFEEPYGYHDVSSTFSRILFVREGHGRASFGHEEHTLSPGQLYFVPPLLSHTIQSESMIDLCYVHFTDLSMKIFNHFHRYPYTLETPSTPWDEQLLTHLLSLVPTFCLDDFYPVSYEAPLKIKSCIKSFHSLPAASRLELNGLLHVLLSRFMDQNASAASVSDIRVSKAIWTINRDLSEVPSLDELAAQACLTQNSFIRLFRLHTGFTPADYIMRRRIMHAQMLFLSGHHSVKEVAHLTGYDNLSYFDRIFKRLVGVTPLAFIQQNP